MYYDIRRGELMFTDVLQVSYKRLFTDIGLHQLSDSHLKVPEGYLKDVSQFS